MFVYTIETALNYCLMTLFIKKCFRSHHETPEVKPEDGRSNGTNRGNIYAHPKYYFLLIHAYSIYVSYYSNAKYFSIEFNFHT